MLAFGKGSGSRAGCSGSVMALCRDCWVWVCVSLPLVPLSAGQSPPQQQSSPSSPACWNSGQPGLAAGMESAGFIRSQATRLHFCCHGYKNEAIASLRISYFYCNYTTGNYLTIFPFISHIVYVYYDASIACTEPPGTGLLLVGAAPCCGYGCWQCWAGAHRQELMLIHFLWNEVKRSCVAGGCSSLCASVSTAQDDWQVCVKTGSGKQSGGKNLQGS